MFIYSVAITHVAADCISFAATFYASHEKSLLTHFVAAPPKIAIADAGLRFCFSNLAVIHSVQIIHAAVSIRAAACGAVMPEPGGVRIQGAEKRFAGVRSF